MTLAQGIMFLARRHAVLPMSLAPRELSIAPAVDRFHLRPRPHPESGFTAALPTYGTVSSPFGNRIHPTLGGVRMHRGIDIAAAAGTPVWASGQGRVVSASWRGGYGLAVEIDHGEGRRSLYAHMQRIVVKAGDEVAAGDTIGAVGSTGRSTGPHLHFEVRVNGEAIDPAVH